MVTCRPVGLRATINLESGRRRAIVDVMVNGDDILDLTAALVAIVEAHVDRLAKTVGGSLSKVSVDASIRLDSPCGVDLEVVKRVVTDLLLFADELGRENPGALVLLTISAVAGDSVAWRFSVYRGEFVGYNYDAVLSLKGVDGKYIDIEVSYALNRPSKIRLDANGPPLTKVSVLADSVDQVLSTLSSAAELIGLATSSIDAYLRMGIGSVDATLSITDPLRAITGFLARTDAILGGISGYLEKAESVVLLSNILVFELAGIWPTFVGPRAAMIDVDRDSIRVEVIRKMDTSEVVGRRSKITYFTNYSISVTLDNDLRVVDKSIGFTILVSWKYGDGFTELKIRYVGYPDAKEVEYGVLIDVIGRGIRRSLRKRVDFFENEAEVLGTVAGALITYLPHVLPWQTRPMTYDPSN